MGRGVRIGRLESDIDINAVSDILAEGFTRERWKWSPGKVKAHIPDAREIEATIRHLLTEIRPSMADDFIMTGGLAVVKSGGIMYLECDKRLAPPSGNTVGA
jgi:hypothetical protein